jgi:hypothetical protein
MSWIEWAVLAAGLAVGYGVVSMLMGERRARERRLGDREPGSTKDSQGGNGPA